MRLYKLLVIVVLSFSRVFSAENNAIQSSKINYRYDLCVCSIFKDEAPYLKEWIEYNKLIGVQHFYLINNDSTDNYLDVLSPYIDSDEVTLVNWSGGHGDWCYKVQGPALLGGVDYFIGIAKWVAIIDIDEFIVPIEHDTLTRFLKDYEDYAAVVVNWQNYGTSGLPELPPKTLMIEALTLKAEEQSAWNQQVKSIVRPERVNTQKQDWTPHLWVYLNGYEAVSPSKKKFTWGPIDVSKIRINHYVHRTDNYFYTQKIEKKARMERTLTADYIRNWRDSCNKVEDKTIFRYVPRLKNTLFPN